MRKRWRAGIGCYLNRTYRCDSAGDVGHFTVALVPTLRFSYHNIGGLRRIFSLTVTWLVFHCEGWLDRKTNEIKARELYDHKVDPAENNNAADDPDYSKIVKKLHKQMKIGWKGCVPSKKDREAK